VKTAYRDVALFPLKKLEYPYSIETVFPPAPTPDNSLRPSARGSAISTPKNSNSVLTNLEEDKLETLTIVDYRYARYALDPRTGLFAPVK
jgi:cation-transporting ATPase 13A2